MADKVRYEIEKMMPDLMLLVKKQYFDKEEVQQIIQQREKHEYTFRRIQKSPVQYLRAIEYEYQLERKRKQQFQLLDLQKESSKDFQIIKRIVKLYDKVCNRFKLDIQLWQDYLRFCYHIKSKKNFSKAVQNCLKYNLQNIDTWIIAAYFEKEINNNPFKARKIFFRALKINKNSEKLWEEYFKFEIEFLQMISKRNQILDQQEKQEKVQEENALDLDVIKFENENETGNNENIIELYSDNVQVLQTIYQSAKETLNSIKICLLFLNVLQQFDSEIFDQINAYVIKDIQNQYNSENIIQFKYNMIAEYYSLRLKNQNLNDNQKIFEQIEQEIYQIFGQNMNQELIQTIQQLTLKQYASNIHMIMMFMQKYNSYDNKFIIENIQHINLNVEQLVEYYKGINEMQLKVIILYKLQQLNYQDNKFIKDQLDQITKSFAKSNSDLDSVQKQNIIELLMKINKLNKYFDQKFMINLIRNQFMFNKNIFDILVNQLISTEQIEPQNFETFLNLQNNCPFSFIIYYLQYLEKENKISQIMQMIKKTQNWYKNVEKFWQTKIHYTQQYGKQSELGQIVQDYIQQFPNRETYVLNEYNQFL